MKRPSTTLYCFSPPVMLATLIIEISAALYIVWRYQLTPITRIATVMLLCLATFQGAEYMVCGGLGVEPGLWSKLGYSAITLLPPLGIHLILTITGVKKPLLVGTAYASAVGFVAYFALLTGAISGQTCYANYVVFSGANVFASWVYAIYYYGWLLVGVALAFALAKHESRRHIKSALSWLGLGYLSFLIPTTLVNIVDPSTISGIPSIMCGFAVILAVFLTIRVVPDASKADSPLTIMKRLLSRS